MLSLNVLFSSLALMTNKVADPWFFDELIRTISGTKAICDSIQHYNTELPITFSILEQHIGRAEANSVMENVAANNNLDKPLVANVDCEVDNYVRKFFLSFG